MIKRLLIRPNMIKPATVELAKTLSEEFESRGVETVVDNELTCHGFDMIIVLGGDGTILRSAVDAAKCGVPVLGVNMGTTGFMNEVEPGDGGWIDRIMNGDYYVEERLMLRTVIRNAGGEILSCGDCLNDVSVERGELGGTLKLSLHVDDHEVFHFAGNGILIATPTGSTAYSLSAGGPVIDPQAVCFGVTPICPHSIGIKPCVVAASRKISVHIPAQKMPAFVMADGKFKTVLTEESSVSVSESPLKTRLIKLRKSCFYNAINAKLTYKGSPE